MKKLIYSTLSLAVAATIFLTGCKGSDGDDTTKPEAPKPTITFDATSGYTSVDGGALTGENIKFKVVVSHSVNLKDIKVTRTYQSTGAVPIDDTIIAGNTKTAQFIVNDIIPTVNGEYTYTFTCTDKDATTSSRTIKIKASGPLGMSEDGIVYSLKSATPGNFSAFDLELGLAITAASGAGNDAARDIVDGSTTADISGVWKSQNGTRFKIGSNNKLNGKALDQFKTTQDLIDAWESSGSGAEQQQITVDVDSKNILIAKVVRGSSFKYVLIGISSIDNPAGSNDDKIVFQYKQ